MGLNNGLSLDELMAVVDRAIKSSPRAARPSLPWGAETQPGMQQQESIMVVDDDAAIRDLLTDFLTRRGYRVQTAEDGPAALSLVEQGAPQLLVLDIYLPGMNGVTVLRELRARHYVGGVIVLSGTRRKRCGKPC